jgi:hypothetical protein
VRTSPDLAITEVEEQDEEGLEPDTEEPLSGARTEDIDRDDDDQKESTPEPYDIEKCTLTFRVEIFPREVVSAPRLALLAVNSHGDEPFKPRLVAFAGDFTALIPHMNDLYTRLGAAMPERAAAAAKRAEAAKARKEAEEAGRKARLAKAQDKGKGKRQRGSRGQTNLLAVPDDGQTAAAPSPSSGREPAGARRSAPGTVAPAPESSPKPIQPPAPVEDPLQGAEPENQEDKKQFSLFL